MNARRLFALPALCIAALSVGACNDETSGPDEPDVTTSLDIAIVDASEDTGEADTQPDATDAGGLDIRVLNCDLEDDLSPNQEETTAYDASEGLIDTDLHICEDTADWFAIAVDAGDQIRVTVERETGERQLDVVLYRAGDTEPGNEIATATNEGSEQELRYRSQTAGRFLVNVSSGDGTEVPYTLNIGSSCAGDDECGDDQRCSLLQQRCVPLAPESCGEDADEPNDSPTTATVLELDGAGSGFAIGNIVCEGDPDYYSLSLDEPTTVRIALDWNGQANLNALVYDARGRFVAGAFSETDNPDVGTAASIAAGDYSILVYSVVVNSGDNAVYALEVSTDASVCESDIDCAVTAGAQLCDNGVCVGFEPAQPGPAGADCDTQSDCADGLFCYQGVPGFSDNYCTALCQDELDCGDFGRNAQCIANGDEGVCVGACDTDLDCPTFYSCQGGSCDLEFCGTDADCGDGQLCRRTNQQNLGLCTEIEFITCDGDDAFEPNDTDSTATVLDGSESGVVCDLNDDWFAIELTEPTQRLELTVTYEGGADLDHYLFDAAGVLVAQTAEEEVSPQVITAGLLPAGRYTLRINQFSVGTSTNTEYEVSAVVESIDGCFDDSDCYGNQPLRITCDLETNACEFLDGDGAVPLGDLCDSEDDCTSDAEFCWAFSGADDGQNICTVRCASSRDCTGVPGTTCALFGGGRFGACLPG
ncbi:MAG: hypothetical protein ACI82G_002347 [Bradymonadia bacterium]|jgi:hypothetical protein